MSSTQPDSDNPTPVNPLDGFGIVTLASLYPVCFVLMLGLAIGDWFSVDDIIERRTHGNKTIEELNAELEEQSSWCVLTHDWRFWLGFLPPSRIPWPICHPS